MPPSAHATLCTLENCPRHPDRRPAEPYEALSHEVLDFQPDQVHLLPELVLSNLQRARKGAAPGPSLLDDEGASDLFVRVTQLVAQAAVPRDAARALGLGRMVALQKPNGRVRGIVIGDFTRRLVARCFAQQKAEAFQEACSPFQFALSTRSGAESVVRLLTAALELDPESTLVSVDGVGAFDTMTPSDAAGASPCPRGEPVPPLCAHVLFGIIRIRVA